MTTLSPSRFPLRTDGVILRWLTVAVVTALTTVFAAVSASAGTTLYEKHQVFYRNDGGTKVRSDFNWSDEGTNPSGTWIQLFGCHFTDTYTGHPEPILRLVRHRPLLPDAYLDERTFTPCQVGSSQNWGNQPAGTYHFDVVREDAYFWPNSLHITSTRVAY